MNISDEAIETAAKALYALENEGRTASTFDQLSPWEVADRFNMARVALEAAGPILMAQAWDECAGQQSHPEANPYRETFAARLARLSIEAVERQWRDERA